MLTTPRSRRTALVIGLTAASLLVAGTTSATTPPAGSAATADTMAPLGPEDGKGVIIGLITKTDTNPFFVKMKEGAEAQAKAVGAELRSFAGTKDGDNETQVQAIETLIQAGAKGILITPSDSKAIVPAVQKAREAGILVIALDTPTEPADAVDITFATDNRLAGQLIGKWALATMGDTAKDAKIALLDLNANQISVDVARDQGFLEGFGIDVKDGQKMGDEDDARIVGNDYTDGSVDGGRTAMENLLQKNGDINVVYTINEPAAQGAYEALKAAGKESQALIVSVDGGCPGVQSVKDGVIGATSQQYPLLMASKGVEAVVRFAKDGSKPSVSTGLDFVNTGVTLITDKPAAGVDSVDSVKGTELCWG